MQYLFAFCFLTSTLFNTAIFNIGGTGIPLFYVNFFIYFFIILAYRLKVRIHLPVLAFTLSLLLLIYIPVFFQIFASSHLETAFLNLKQLIAMSLLILNGFLLFSIMWETRFALSLKSIHKFIFAFFMVFFTYGIYTFFAPYLDLSTFLDFLRNSNSFPSIEALHTDTGWSGTFRAFSVWAEPSFSALPVAVMFILSNVISGIKKSSKLLINVLIFSYAFSTFSRLVFVTYVVVLSCYCLFKFASSKHIALLNPLIIMGIFIVGTYLTVISPRYFPDLSAYGRACSLIIGWRIFLDNFFIGAGFNTYPLLEAGYNYGLYGLEYFPPETTTHNLALTYAYQLGMFGLLFILLLFVFPIYFIVRHVNVSGRVNTISMSMFLVATAVIGAFGGNVIYFGIFWVFYYYFLFLLLRKKGNIYESGNAN